MKQSKLLSLHGKTLFILALCFSIPFISIWYIVQSVSENVFYRQKSEHLMSIAKVLDTHLPDGGYDELLNIPKPLPVTREEKITVLNEALRDITDEVSLVSDGLGVGFYSLDLDAILTYGPSSEHQDTIGTSITPGHPGWQVMVTNTPMVEMGSMVRGNIMNAMYPVVRNNTVIGYIWANELVSDLEMTLQKTSGLILLLLLLAYILIFIIVIIFLRKMIQTEQKAHHAVAQALEETQHLDRLMHLVNEAVATLLMADGDHFEAALHDCMHMMGTALEVDRIAIWRCHSKNESDAFDLHLSAWWLSEFINHENHAIIDLSELDLSNIKHFSDWQEKLAANQSVKLSYSSLSEQEQEQIKPLGILTWTAVPVFLQENFWGFVSFCNCCKERDIAEDEQAVLLSGSLLMANAISRNEMLQHLVQAHEDALAGTKAKSAFLASMSHEIRTPVNAIVGMAAVGKAASEPQRKDYAFGKIENASAHLIGVINDVLDISKIESGKLELSPVEFNFERMLRGAADVVSQSMKVKNLDFIIEIDPLIPPKLISDDQRLAQVITNLLSNASKFTHQGSISLTASLLEKKETSCILQIDISDTGIGISPEQQKKIFESFEQAENSTTRRYGGTGLGLSISKNIVELMGGKIWMKSELGNGSTFSFSIKADCPESASDQDAMEHDFNEEGISADFTGKHILLAEDVEINCEILIALLEPTGLTFDCAENGLVAKELFIQSPDKYDLIFMDIHMPELDGLEASRQIRQLELPGAESIPIIAMTANVFKDDIEKCLEAGMNDHIGKPIDMDKVISILKKYLL